MNSALFIGRFQPFHKGHLSVVQEILKKHDRVIIVIGSAETNYQPENPLTAGERVELIEESLMEAGIKNEKFLIIPVRNVNNYALWVNHINSYIPPYVSLYTGSEIVKACYEGKYSRTHRANKIGPTLIQLKRLFEISATKIREAILHDKKWEEMVTKSTAALLKKWNIPTRIKTIHNTIDVTKYNSDY